jgi:hypothetical protein
VETVSGEAFRLKKSDIKKVDVTTTLFLYICPICGQRITGYTLPKTIMYAKLHIKRSHGLEVVVED